MEPFANVAFLLGVVAYSVASTLYFVDLARPAGAATATTWATRALAAGSALHSVHLVLTSFVTGTCPIASLPFALSFSAWVLAMAYWALGRKLGVAALGVAVAPLALTFLVGAHFVGTAPVQLGLSRVLLMAHISANVLGLGLFLLAGAAGLFYLVQERRLKHKRRALHLGRFPALDLLDTTEHRLLLTGFPLLTFGVVTGMVFMSRVAEMSASAQLRAGLAYLAWAVVAAVLVLRALAGWRGRRAAMGTLLGLSCVLLVVLVYVARAVGVGAV